jgi:CrcB protein
VVSADTDPHGQAGAETDESPIRPPGTLRWLPLIMLGGGLGTAARAGLETLFPPAPAAVPWTTLLINVIGSFVLGVLVEALSAAGPDRGVRRAVRLTLGTGVLGGFTTYSTFMVETADRLRDGHVSVALAYLLGSLVLGLVAAAFGISIASLARRRLRGHTGMT